MSMKGIGGKGEISIEVISLICITQSQHQIGIAQILTAVGSDLKGGIRVKSVGEVFMTAREQILDFRIRGDQIEDLRLIRLLQHLLLSLENTLIVFDADLLKRTLPSSEICFSLLLHLLFLLSDSPECLP